MVDTFDWDALKSFLAVARTGRLTAAAQELGVDHSTLNRRINALEKALAAKLFDRRPNGYALTGQGARLMASAEAMESAAISALREVGNEAQTVGGTVRIGTPDGFGTLFLAPRLGRLADAHPNLAIQLVTQPRLFSLSQREADIAIGLARPNKGRLKARKLIDYELGLYASRDYVAAHGEPAERAQLKSYRFIGYIDEMVYAPELDYVDLVGEGLRPALADVPPDGAALGDVGRPRRVRAALLHGRRQPPGSAAAANGANQPHVLDADPRGHRRSRPRPRRRRIHRRGSAGR